jgi:DNA mismatch repair protein MutS2
LGQQARGHALDKHTLEVLGFPRIRELLSAMCSTDRGREWALALLPSGSRAAVETELGRLSEIIALPEEPPMADIADIGPLLSHLGADGVLTGPELLRVLRTCRGVRQCGDFLNRHRSDLTSVDSLVRSIQPLPELEHELDRALDENGDVQDGASHELHAVRADLRRKRNGLVSGLDRIAAVHPDWFSGGVTVRGERLVLALRLEHRNRLPGVVHGSSGTGQTLFVEPFALVADGNAFQELKDAETEEVARILRSLSRSVAAQAAKLRAAIDAAGEIDLLVAKRRFAARYDCSRPAVAADGRVEVVQGRHPLLVQRGVAVVPLQFQFPSDASVVLISGPNAGGKTVVLKTLGLFSLMLGCGMYLPAAGGSTLPVFRSVFADIGDEQSLDGDLSSFTAHLVRLKEILELADDGSLVLIDEIGASTAPEEGAALASAVLEALRDRGVRSVVTTHFGALKMFAQDEQGMANAAMEWGMTRTASGEERYGPTYHLRMGFPGESSAFEIAAGAGMPANVLDRARSRLGREWLDFSAKLRALDEELTRTQVARRRAEQELGDARRSRQQLEDKTAEAQRTAVVERERLRSEQERFLVGKRREIENLVRSIREHEADHESVVVAKRAVEQGLSEIALEPELPRSEPGVGLEFRAGDCVWSRTFQRQGVVVELRDSTASVAFGQIRMQLDLSDISPAQGRPASRAPEPVVEEPYFFDPHLNIMGMIRDDAETAVRRFLDDAAMNGARDLWVLHGKGTGVLRRMLWQQLKSDTRVEQVQQAEPSQGGGGVTVIRLKG